MAVQSRIYIGTSGWSYPKGEGTWSGYFYPSGKINELEYYSRFFNTVEVNSSFYRPPDPSYVNNWAKRVPDGFLFTVKLWQKFTHPGMYKIATGEDAVISQNDVDLFKRGIEPLVKSGKMGALLAQFPPSFKNDSFGQNILSIVIKVFSDYRMAVELRDRSWSDDNTTANILTENNVAWVQIDEPKFPSSIAAEVPVTADMSYFRFHGRNAEMWWKGDSETRYKYLYSTDEVNNLAQKIKVASERSVLTFVMFNNHWQGYAPRNATDMKKALKLPFIELPIQTELQDDKAEQLRKLL